MPPRDRRRPPPKPRKASSPESMTVTIAEACELIGIGMTTFYRAVKAGDIHVIKYGSRTLVMRSEIDRFLQSLQDRATA
jgi:excisionase family DNA binding protein